MKFPFGFRSSGERALRPSASSLCAGGSLLVLSGFLAVNLAGCGGGGGGGNNPSTVTANFLALLQDGSPATGGQVRILNTDNSTVRNAPIGSNGRVSISNLTPGSYQVAFILNGLSGECIEDASSQGTPGIENCAETVRPLTVSSQDGQTYRLIQNDFFKAGAAEDISVLVRGRILDAEGGESCSDDSSPITEEVRIRVFDVSGGDRRLVKEIVRSPQSTNDFADESLGSYLIALPTDITTFRVEVDPSPSSGARQLKGFSELITITGSEPVTSPYGVPLIDEADICADDDGTPPIPNPTPQPTPTLRPTSIPTGTPAPTNTPDPNAPTPTATATATSTPTATNTPTATGTPTTTAVPTNTPTLEPFFTPTPTTFGVSGRARR